MRKLYATLNSHPHEATPISSKQDAQRQDMDQNDNDLQGTDGSGFLGGLDVRRQIPIKLLSKQTERGKLPARPQRPNTRLPSKSEEEPFSYNQEERFECKSGDAYGNQRRFPQPIFWDYKLNLVGVKDDTPVHFCDKCGLPIKIYGRMIPCKHVFCYDCAVHYEKKCDKMCPGLSLYSCSDLVQRIEQCERGSLFMCSIVQSCKRTYLSQRDLQAHINHRHLRASKTGSSRPDPPHPALASDPPDRFRLPPPPHLAKTHPLVPPPLQGHDTYNHPPPTSPSDLGPSPRPLPPETFRIATVTTRKHSNLITVPIYDDSRSSGPCPHEPHPQTPPGPPPHHHPGDYASQPVVSHPHHIMTPPQQPHYGPPLPPSPLLSIPIQHPPQGSATPHIVYNQPPPMSTPPPPGHIISQLPPYMNHPPPGPIPPVSAHHYNPNSMPQDQSALSPPFTQPGAMSPGMWPNPHGPHPSRMQGPPPQGQMPGPHHPDQSRYRPYY
ncbi:E3 ubiquitin-protein ligase Hakai-like isoform X1 [Carassius carassius]|uniref:E3 ubiquitin-protein ligase Hakai-like isoform X1 n=1 Tax=Carassius carassius TaxID=217509 RepID=UPI002868D829|nr:E3 ubiquitin-protein ligase Hakai-like isoform X1 [Carassius carassius]